MRRTIVEDYDSIHTEVGLLGNLLFVLGSVLFLWESTKDLARMGLYRRFVVHVRG